MGDQGGGEGAVGVLDARLVPAEWVEGPGEAAAPVEILPLDGAIVLCEVGGADETRPGSQCCGNEPRSAHGWCRRERRLETRQVSVGESDTPAHDDKVGRDRELDVGKKTRSSVRLPGQDRLGAG